jgi:uncharacterized membrane protein YphA (DoxX/SURF4 family)
LVIIGERQIDAFGHCRPIVQRRRRKMDAVLWVLQWVLAVMFLMAGAMKVMQSKEKLAEKMAWANDYPANTIKAIGMAEILAAVGLVVPPLTGIAPVLAPLAALGLVALMIGAAMVHKRRNETAMLMMNMMLGVLALVVVWGRFGPEAF